MNITRKRLFQVSIALNIVLISMVVWGIIKVNFVKEQVFHTEVQSNLVELEGLIAAQSKDNWSAPNLVTTKLNDVLNGIWLGMTTGDQLGTLSYDDKEVLQKLYFKLKQYPHDELYQFVILTEKDKENFVGLREKLRNAELGLKISIGQNFMKQADKLEKTITSPINELPSDNTLTSTSLDKKPILFPDKSDLKFSDLKDVEFWFGSGAGAWCTTVTIQSDGTFKGHFRDDDATTASECFFSGHFSPLKKIGSYEYSMKCEFLKQEGTVGEKKLVDGKTVTTSTPYGFDNAGEFRLYLPGKKAKELSEDYLSWTNGTVSDDILPSYGLYNVEGKQGFIVWPK